jgi:hypothetical protein
VARAAGIVSTVATVAGHQHRTETFRRAPRSQRAGFRSNQDPTETNGANVSTTDGLGNIQTTWTIAHTGEYNGDGMSDLLWRDNLGNTSVWLMHGATVLSAARVGNIPTAWTVQSVSAE